MTPPATETVAGLLAADALPVAGLYRRHPARNLAAVAAAITGAYQGTGPVRLGQSRALVVIAVDGLGYEPAASGLQPDSLDLLTSEFPTTTVACLLTSVTGQTADRHGFIGVQYLHADGRSTVNCHDGTVTAPHATAPARPARTPRLPTVFDELAAQGVPVTLLANELAGLSPSVVGRLAHGARPGGPELPPGLRPADMVDALARQIAEHAPADGLLWVYLDLDTYGHRHGYDEEIAAAVSALSRLAGRLRDAGTAVLVFSDHGLAPSRPRPETLAAWRAAEDRRWCRLPGGGAGRARWLYPRPGQEDRLAARLADWFPDAVLTTPGQLADWGLVADSSIGQRRLGELVLLARGPDFPVPDPGARFEHGSMTADEIAVPLAVWSPP